MRASIEISKKMFCPFCNKETEVCSKFVYNEINCKKYTPYCEVCRNNFDENIIKTIEESFGEIRYYNIEFITSNKYVGFVFDPSIPVYEYEHIKRPFFVMISSAVGWFLIVLLLYFNDPTIGISTVFIMSIMSWILLIGGIAAKVNNKKINDMFTYIIDNGKCYKGIVKNVLEFHAHYDNRIDKHYFLEVEYFDDINKEKKTVITPEIVKLPNKSDIECDVYVVEELPEKYKNFKDRRNTAIINFR